MCGLRIEYLPAKRSTGAGQSIRSRVRQYLGGSCRSLYPCLSNFREPQHVGGVRKRTRRLSGISDTAPGTRETLA